jgi:mannose-6-phosphate isomerase-like protein (cupin superfamily)
VDEDSFNLFPNTTLVIPAQATRQAVNTSEEDLVILVIRSLVRPPEKSMMEIMGKM